MATFSSAVVVRMSSHLTPNWFFENKAVRSIHAFSALLVFQRMMDLAFSSCSFESWKGMTISSFRIFPMRSAIEFTQLVCGVDNFLPFGLAAGQR
jgi:hypothetical protein